MINTLQPGSLVGGKYRLEKLLGAGSMGSVWAARNQLTDRAFAIKFMLPAFAQDPVLVQRFLNEAKVCGRIDHPSVVEIYDLGVADELEGAPFLVMELLRGEGLDVMLDRVGRLDPKSICPIIVEIASALDQAHQSGVVHRDVKPSNIFLHRSRSGDVTPKLLDFGVSKILEGRDADADITRVGSVLGSPLYMSPEQARGQSDIDPRADIWGLGVVLYEAISGDLPFSSGNFNAVLSAILTSRHKPLRDVAPGVPLALSDAVDLCLVKDRNRRMATAAQLASRLEEILLQVAEPPRAPSRAPTPLPPLPLTFDESTEVMTRDDLRAILPSASSPEISTDDGDDGYDEDAPPLSRTSELRRVLLAELGPSVSTSKTDDISEKIPLNSSGRLVRVQRVEGQISDVDQRLGPASRRPPSEPPPSDPPDEQVEEPPSVPPPSIDISATSEAIKAAREHLIAGAPASDPPTAPSDPPAAPAALEAPPAPRPPATPVAPARNQAWLVLAAVLMALSILVAVLSRR